MRSAAVLINVLGLLLLGWLVAGGDERRHFPFLRFCERNAAHSPLRLYLLSVTLGKEAKPEQVCIRVAKSGTCAKLGSRASRAVDCCDSVASFPHGVMMLYDFDCAPAPDVAPWSAVNVTVNGQPWDNLEWDTTNGMLHIQGLPYITNDICFSFQPASEGNTCSTMMKLCGKSNGEKGGCAFSIMDGTHGCCPVHRINAPDISRDRKGVPIDLEAPLSDSVLHPRTQAPTSNMLENLRASGQSFASENFQFLKDLVSLKKEDVAFDTVRGMSRTVYRRLQQLRHRTQGSQ